MRADKYVINEGTDEHLIIDIGKGSFALEGVGFGTIMNVTVPDTSRAIFVTSQNRSNPTTWIYQDETAWECTLEIFRTLVSPDFDIAYTPNKWCKLITDPETAAIGSVILEAPEFTINTVHDVYDMYQDINKLAIYLKEV